MSGSNNSWKMAWTNRKPFPGKNPAGRLLQPSKTLFYFTTVNSLSLGLFWKVEVNVESFV